MPSSRGLGDAFRQKARRVVLENQHDGIRSRQIFLSIDAGGKNAQVEEIGPKEFEKHPSKKNGVEGKGAGIIQRKVYLKKTDAALAQMPEADGANDGKVWPFVKDL